MKAVTPIRWQPVMLFNLPPIRQKSSSKLKERKKSSAPRSCRSPKHDSCSARPALPGNRRMNTPRRWQRPGLRSRLFFEKKRFLACFFPGKGYIIGYHFCGAVAQLARAIRSHRIGRGFNSHLLHHFLSSCNRRPDKDFSSFSS